MARAIEGRRCGTKRALLNEFARVLAFPPHFGRTWDALEDCLTDLDWLPGAGLPARHPRGRPAAPARCRELRTYSSRSSTDVGRAWGDGGDRPSRARPGPVPHRPGGPDPSPRRAVGLARAASRTADASARREAAAAGAAPRRLTSDRGTTHAEIVHVAPRAPTRPGQVERGPGPRGPGAPLAAPAPPPPPTSRSSASSTSGARTTSGPSSPSRASSSTTRRISSPTRCASG